MNLAIVRWFFYIISIVFIYYIDELVGSLIFLSSASLFASTINTSRHNLFWKTNILWGYFSIVYYAVLGIYLIYNPRIVYDTDLLLAALVFSVPLIPDIIYFEISDYVKRRDSEGAGSRKKSE